MALAYLLETNVLSDLVRHPQGAVAARIAALGESTTCASVVVGAELRFGAAKSASTLLADRVDLLLSAVGVLPLVLPVVGVLPLVLSAVGVLPLEPPADRRHAELRCRLATLGTPIGANDTLVAAHALALGLTVVTANREFAQVPGLATENWLAG